MLSTEKRMRRPCAEEVVMQWRSNGLHVSVIGPHVLSLETALTDLAVRDNPFTAERAARFARHFSRCTSVNKATGKHWSPKLDDLLGKRGDWSGFVSMLDECDACPKCIPAKAAPTPVRAPGGPGRPNPTEAPSGGQKNASEPEWPTPEKRAELVAIARSYRERAVARRPAMPPPIPALEPVGEG